MNRKSRRAAKAAQRKQTLPELGALISIGLPWPHSASGTVEWRLVDWTVEDDDGPSLPMLDDGHPEDEDGGPVAWGSDYAALDQAADEWVFPDGERCDNEDLKAAFARRRKAVQ